MLIHSDPNNINSIVYHLIIERYSMKILHWYFPWATALDLYNMTGRGEKLQQLHCYHTFSDSLDIYLTKNHYENYSPKMVPIAKIWGSGSWTSWPLWGESTGHRWIPLTKGQSHWKCFFFDDVIMIRNTLPWSGVTWCLWFVSGAPASPSPPPQRLLTLTSKPLMLNLR